MTPTVAAPPGTINAFRPKTIGLRCSLSYVKLFEFKFKALEDVRPFDPARAPHDASQPWLEKVPTGYEVVVARNEILPDQMPVVQTFGEVLRYAPRQLKHYYTDMTGGAAAAFQGMSAKTRSTITRKVRAYKQFCGGEIRLEVYRTPEELETYFQLARELSRRTYQERLFESGLPETEEFRHTALDLARRDAVRAFLLFDKDKPVAYLYTPAPDGFLVYDYVGYDPAYASHSPGTVLQYLAFEQLYAEQKFPLYYWGYGYSQTKKIFSTGEVLGADIFYFRATFRNRFAVGVHRSADRFSEWAGAILQRWNLKQSIKRLLKKQ
jgi:CelD/BcsL family acetyltransferase involved in cellulose biosynthesis